LYRYKKEGGFKKSGRCRLCAKLHKEGQYCPVCSKVWQWANCPAMVGCDTCSYWVHAACDCKAKEVMDAPENEEVDYFCPICRDKSEKEEAKRAQKEKAAAAAAAKSSESKAKSAEAKAEAAEAKVGLYTLCIQSTHSLKAPGFNP
jgi:hypothetical protein